MPGKILIVDDDQEFREELKDALEEYGVIEASSGMAALEFLSRAHEIGVVILDVMMPGPSGTEILEEIRKSDPDLGIIILTGHSSKDIAIEAVKGHADDYLEKPVDIYVLKETIEKLLTAKDGKPDSAVLDLKGKIDKVKSFVERNCYKKTTLKEAAESVYLSPKYLSRAFKEHAGIGFSEYKLKIKMSKAKELLVGVGYNVNQLSNKLGYENAESFIRQFKKLTRFTPTEFRKKILNKKLSGKIKK